jgi:hypothetical protein
MDSDDDAPPELVQTGAVPVESHEVTVKVPITIVTGMAKSSNPIMLLTSVRISRCWEDYIAQLYPDGPTWQEDCSDYERFVM